MNEKPEDDCAGAEMMGVMQVLQSAEQALVDNGWTEYMVRTEHGVWTWNMDKQQAEPAGADDAQT